MKIMHVSKKYPQALGGDAVVVSNLERQQEAAGHEVRIVTSNCAEIVEDDHTYKLGLTDTSSGLDAITPRRLASLVVLFFRMFAILRRERPDIIHTHSVDMAFFVSLVARFFGIPIVHTFHAVTCYDENQSALRRKAEVWLAKKAGACRITAPNNYDVEKLRVAGLSNTVLLPNGVDLTFWGKNVDVPKGGDFMFLTIGRLEQVKGYDYLIRAAALLAATSTAFRVVITGEGSQEAALRELARSLHLESVVTFAGRQTPERIRELLAEAEAAVFPSLNETTPLTLLEAWAAGTPAIVTSVGILRDVPAGFGAAYIVPTRDDQALMQAMYRCMTDAETRSTVAAQGHKEAQKYTWPAIAQTVEAIYASVWQKGSLHEV